MTSLLDTIFFEFAVIAFTMPIWMFGAGFVSIYVRIWLYRPSVSDIEKFLKELKSVIAFAYTGVDGAPIGYPRDFNFLQILIEFQKSRTLGKMVFVLGSFFAASPFLALLLLFISDPYLKVHSMNDDMVFVIFVIRKIIKVVFVSYFTLKAFSFGKSLKVK